MNSPIWGVHYRLEVGKGYGEARWGVLTKDGRTEVAAGLMYDEAKRVFDRSETLPDTVAPGHATLSPLIVEFEEVIRAEGRNRKEARWK